MTRRWLLLGAAAIVCATNLAALGHGALNRRGAGDATIVLTERELPVMSFDAESTVTVLRVEWTARDQGFSCDEIRPLGFTCPDRTVSSDDREYRQSHRTGYVVLEYDGPAWEKIRERREAEAAESAARNPSAAPPARRPNAASHLVAIDIGADAAALRRAYPEASRYLITGARIALRPAAGRDSPSPGPPAGFIVELLPSAINVPLPFSTTIREAGVAHAGDPAGSWTPRYAVTLRYGRFLEPWIVEVRLMPK